MNKILNIEAVKYPNSVEALRTMYANVKIHIRHSDALEVKPGSYGHLFFAYIHKKS